MKKIALLAMLLIMGAAPSFAHFLPHGSVGVSFNIFYSSLGAHGDWIPVDGGIYAWRPMGVAVGWRPYTVGRWIWTDDGWYWASDEPWGWAAYHYGRWYYDDFYGWVWIPGYDWAPAWVEWRYGGDYIGWAPLGPYAVFHISFGIHYSRHWVTPAYYWSFLDCRHVGSPSVHRYVYRTEHNTRYIGRTRTVGNVRYDRGRIVSRGPEREFVERRGNVRIPRADVVDVNDRPVERVVRTGDRERVEVYRPRIEERSGEKDRPGRIRESGRKIDIDTRQMDVRSREVDRETGRDTRKAEEYRDRETKRQDVDARREAGRPEQRDPVRREDGSSRQDRPSIGRTDRSGERKQPAVQQERPRTERQVERKQQADQKRERPQKQEFRSPTPERTVRRSEPRQEQTRQSPQREGGRREETTKKDRRR
jgi:hypothetical protein